MKQRAAKPFKARAPLDAPKRVVGSRWAVGPRSNLSFWRANERLARFAAKLAGCPRWWISPVGPLPM